MPGTTEPQRADSPNEGESTEETVLLRLPVHLKQWDFGLAHRIKETTLAQDGLNVPVAPVVSLGLQFMAVPHTQAGLSLNPICPLPNKANLNISLLLPLPSLISFKSTMGWVATLSLLVTLEPQILPLKTWIRDGEMVQWLRGLGVL